MHRRYLEYWLVLLLLLFLTHTVSLRDLWDIRPNASSWVFLFSVQFVEVLLCFPLGIIPSSLQGGQSRYLSLWRDFMWWSLVLWIFFSSSEVFSQKIFFHLRFFDGAHFQYSQVFESFCSEGSVFFPQLVLFFLLFVIFFFSLFAWSIFLCQIPTVYLHCTSSLPIVGFPNLFRFWQTVIIVNHREFFTPEFADGHSLEFEWKQVTSSL